MMNIAYFYMTGQGEALVGKLSSVLPGTVYNKENYKDGIKKQWDRSDALVFVMASGIVVRMVAPYIQSKTKDPAVIVIDQNGQFVISLLSGHLGGANALAKKLAAVCGGTPVITTATDVEGVPAMDVFAKENHLSIENIEKLKFVSSAMIEGRPVTVISERKIEGTFPKNVRLIYVGADCDSQLKSKREHSEKTADWSEPAAAVVIAKEGSVYADCFLPAVPVLYLTLRPYIVGVGCKRDMAAAALSEAFSAFAACQKICAKNVRAFATIELKKDEAGIRALSEAAGAELLIFTKDEISAVDFDDAGGQRIEQSEFVRQVTGVGSVSEACAYLGSDGGKILAGKTKYSGITFALAENKGALKL